MDKQSHKVKEPSVPRDDPDRQARLAEALRANLRRRKAQARAVADEGATSDRAEPDRAADPSQRGAREGGTP